MPGPYIQSWKKVSTIAKHIQTQSEWEQTMARRVMEQLRGELYLDQRYLTAALGALPAAPRESGGSFATDGGALYYPTAWLLDTYRRNRRYPAPGPTCTACSTASSGISGCGTGATPTCGGWPVTSPWRPRWTP